MRPTCLIALHAPHALRALRTLRALRATLWQCRDCFRWCAVPTRYPLGAHYVAHYVAHYGAITVPITVPSCILFCGTFPNFDNPYAKSVKSGEIHCEIRQPLREIREIRSFHRE